MEEKYYYEHDEEYEIMPYRIYEKDTKPFGDHMEIAKAYDKEGAKKIVNALNIYESSKV